MEGGQDTEDAKRDEIFWNEILAPDEIDCLLAPKVFTNYKRHDSKGAHKIKDFGEHDNLIIRGNNLLALYSLKKCLAGQVKLIYIDPPYNTGNDSFGYNDSFNHSSWLTFMKNRLEVAKSFLRKDGSIWINIGDDEAHYLKVLCDEIFGRENFVRNVVWQKRTSPDTRATLGDGHDHILVFAKNLELFKEAANRLPKSEQQRANFKNPDDDPFGPWVSSDFTAQGYRPNQMYKIVTPGGKEYFPPEGRCWKNVENIYLKLVADGRMWFGNDGFGVPRRKTYLYEIEDNSVWSWWTNSEVGHNQEAKKESIALFGADNPFPTPKPERLLSRIIQIGSREGDLILDFFAGSGTSGSVAHKLKRNYLLIEQMDYVDTHTIERLKKVIGINVKIDGKILDEIEYDKGGISKSVHWQGGGSFVSCELKEWNEVYSRKIKAAKSEEVLHNIWKEMQEKAYLSYRLDVKQFNANASVFADLLLEEQEHFLLEALDKNHLYVNLSEMDDETYGVSEDDKRLNRLFYKL